MNPYWLTADLVLVVHMLLFPVLLIGSVAAAMGILRAHVRLAIAFWGTFSLSALWQFLPSCILTDVEKWLRHRVDADWDRQFSVQRVIIKRVTGIDFQEWVFFWLGVALVLMTAYAFWKYHRDQAKDLWGRFRRWAD